MVDIIGMQFIDTIKLPLRFLKSDCFEKGNLLF